MPDHQPELTEPDSELIIHMTHHDNARCEESPFLPALGRGEEAFQLIFKAAEDAIFIKDCDLKYIYVNPAAERLFGIPASKIVGCTAEVWLDTPGADHAAQVDHRVLQGEVIEKEVNYLHKQPPLIFQVLKFPMRNASGEIIGLCSIAHDITKHKQTEMMLQKAQAELEQRVAERTAALSTANAQLKEQIAERKRAEVKLAEEHNLLRTLIDNLPDFIFVKDCQSRFLINNKAHAFALGVTTPDELVGYTDFNLVPQGLAEQYCADDRMVIESGKPLLEREEPFVDRTGRQRWLSTTKIPLKDSQGQVVGLVGVSRDITDSKQTAEALKQRAAHLALINELGRQITAVLELDQVLKKAADLVQEIFEYHHVALFMCDDRQIKLKAVAGPYEDHFPPGHSQSLDEGIVGWVAKHGQKLVVNNVSLDARYTPSIPDQTAIRAELCLPIKMVGRTKGVLDIQSPDYNAFAEKDVIALEALTNQIAVAIENARLYETIQQELIERKRVEEIQRESEEKYRALIEQSDDAIFLIHGNKFELINPKFEELFGVTLEDANAPDFAFSNIIANKSQRQIVEQARQGKPGKKRPPRYEFTALDKHSNEIEVELSVSYPTYRGGLATQGVLRDITERKRAERALVEERALLAQRVEERTAELSTVNAELARAVRLKDEFLASMSHELRTPLNGILGVSELLTEGIYGPLNEKQHKGLHSIEESGRHLLSLINDILDLSKIEAGKLELQIEPVSLESICQASLRMIKQMAHKKNLTVSFKLDEAVTVIHADGRRLKQILVNLLSNAVKFTPEGGSIELEIAGHSEQQVVHFIVRDTGIGIAKKDLGRLFRSFVQVDSSLSREHAGTGLGLALVRRLTELHDGGVSVESEVGQGSCFVVSLPWRQADNRTEQTPPPNPGADTTRRSAKTKRPVILLVEDNEITITTSFDYLQVKNYHVIIARSGSEALDRVREKQPDIILMDIQMPGMDGLETMRRLRAYDNLAAIPIIALTALTMPGDREKCLDSGANDYMSKPLNFKELTRLIEKHLRG